MNDMERLAQDYDRVEQAIVFLAQNVGRQPSLLEVAEGVGLSEFHFQRLFSRWVGISPKRFLQYLTKEHAKKLLEGSQNLLDATYDAGLSSPSRLHDLFITCEAMSPGEYREKGRGLQILYGFHPSPFGTCLVALTAKGVCGLKFVQNGNREAVVSWLRRLWPKADLVHNDAATGNTAGQIFTFGADCDPAPLYLYVRGTNFQIKVWEALTEIPLGKAVSYEDLGRHIGMPTAARAIGNAVGSNPIPFLIPCHRVIKKLGDFGNYGEGPARKKAILGWETVVAEQGFSLDREAVAGGV